LVLAVSFMAMAMLPDPLNNISLLTAVGFCVSLFITFQDIATDALVIDIVPMDQQAKANGFMWGSKIAGTAASLATGTWLLTTMDFLLLFFFFRWQFF
jgi:PAT family beta-lactamase induction signal transducer AmpG